jgi:hypothetical protein
MKGDGTQLPCKPKKMSASPSRACRKWQMRIWLSEKELHFAESMVHGGEEVNIQT